MMFDTNHLIFNYEKFILCLDSMTHHISLKIDLLELYISIILIIIYRLKMSRRPVSPIRSPLRTSENDPRENMIRKLKEDLIVARGKEKELAIL